MLIFEIIFGSVIGFLLGLFPSLHINTIGFLFLSFGFFAIYPQHLFFFISISVAQMITSFVPCCLFGIPNDQNILSIFPTHKLFLEGKAKFAIFLCMLGCFLGVCGALLLLPILFLFFNVLGSFSFFIYSALLFVLIMFVFEEKKLLQKMVVLSIIIFSGSLGILTLNISYFLKEPLLVCIFGLFASPFLLISCFKKQKQIIQKEEVDEISPPFFLSFLGSFVSLFIILLPSFSSAQAGIIISKIKNNLSSLEYIVLFASISISSLIFSFFLAFTFYKSRLGYIVVLRSTDVVFGNVDFVIFGFVVFISAMFVILLVLFFLDDFIYIVNKTKLRVINVIVYIFSLVLVVSVSGYFSLVFIFISSCIGFLPIIYNKRRVILMSYIMIPTLLYYI